MEYVEACGDYRAMPHPWVFLAGGITGCPDWQGEVVRALRGVRYGTLMNPRREDFPMGDQAEGVRQIEWERSALWAAHVVAFWFSEGPSVQPIALFELGAQLSRRVYGRSPRLVVGVHAEYSRRFDVQTQLAVQEQQDGVVVHTVETLDEYVQGIERIVTDVAWGLVDWRY